MGHVDPTCAGIQDKASAHGMTRCFPGYSGMRYSCHFWLFSSSPFPTQQDKLHLASISNRPVCQSQSLMLSKYLLYIELLVQEWKLSGKPQARVWFLVKPLTVSTPPSSASGSPFPRLNHARLPAEACRSGSGQIPKCRLSAAST